jgi:glyoxylase-like metal-dependent hydrolase (beta-lactamase superfamily II)
MKLLTFLIVVVLLKNCCGFCFVPYLKNFNSKPITEKFNGNFTQFRYQLLTTIHHYEPKDKLVNSYIIELPCSLVIFDAQLKLSNSRELLKYAQLLGKPMNRILISHRHADHWYGTITFDGKTSISSYKEIITEIREQGQSSIDRDTPRYPGEVPEVLIVPDTIQKEGYERINYVPFVFKRLENTEASNTLILNLPLQKVLFVGDFLFSKTHLFLGEKTFDTWIKTLEDLKTSFNGYTIFVGHGKPGDSRLFQENIDYLRYAIESYNNNGNFSTFKDAMVQKYPDYNLPSILDLAANALYPKTD